MSPAQLAARIIAGAVVLAALVAALADSPFWLAWGALIAAAFWSTG